jgi:filamentous hemagglutinin
MFWMIIDPNVVKQVTPTSCGAACAEMMLKDRGILSSQIELGTRINFNDFVGQ